MTSYSTCVEHIRCPECAKKGRDTKGNNLGVYSDGHKYCFSCGYVESNTIAKVKARNNIIPEQDLSLPYDVSSTIGHEGLTWLAKYGITREDILKNRLLWSDRRSMLIFPVFINNTMVMWQGRNFGDAKNKWFTKGKPENHTYVINYLKNKPIVLVEDIVSAIRVGHILPSSPLFGSHVSNYKFKTLTLITDSLIFWLDNDKLLSSYKYKDRGKIFNLKSKVIYTIKDPKEYTNEQIKQLVEGEK